MAAFLAAGLVPVPLLAADAMHGHGTDHGHAGASGRFSPRDFPASLGFDEALLVVFFVCFLLLAGIVLWEILQRSRTRDMGRFAAHHVLQWQRLVFLAVLANLARLIWLKGGLDDLSVLRSLPYEQSGLAWLVLFALSVFGLFFLHRGKLFDTVWLFLAIAAATQIGHADLSLDHVLSSVLSGIHLLAAALWIGGLYMLLAKRKRFRYDAERLAPNVMNASLAAMVLLFVSGLANSALYLPDLGLITMTRWGLILTAKVFLFALLVLVMLLVRKRGAMRSVGLIRLQFAVVLFLAAISGIMPISEPVPSEGPLHWHVMGEDVHMTAEIDPLRQGLNEYRVTVWFPEGTGAPQSVEMVLAPDGRDGEARVLELVREAKRTDVHFVGFADYHYKAAGGHIDGPGRWTIEVRIVDAAGKRWTFDREAIIY